MIIGLTGRNGAGKGEAAQFLKDSGFLYHSLSDVIREAVKTTGQEITRQALVMTGNRLRTEHGPGILAERVLSRLAVDCNYVIDSIRHPKEVEVLRRNPDFNLVAIDAPPALRFERLVRRAREADPTSFAEFARLEAREEAHPDSHGQQLAKTIKLAAWTVVNDGEKLLLHDRLRAILREVGKKKTRPPWDEYFMGIARVAALRSNCIKRKVAAVIVRDRRVISTGYNGTPRGLTNCLDGGCPRCMSFGKSGEDLGECLCSHAEENAIVQAAYHGVALKGATIYTTFSPCLMCTKMIVNSGLVEVVYNLHYSMAEVPLKLLGEAYVKVRKVE